MKTKYVLTTGLVLVLGVATEAQVLNRLKQRVENKAEQKAGEEIDKLFSGKNKTNQDNQDKEQMVLADRIAEAITHPIRVGLISTPPDVNQNLTEAQAAYKK